MYRSMSEEDLELPPADGDAEEAPGARDSTPELETPDDDPWDDAESDHLGIPQGLLDTSINAKENQSLEDDSEGLDEEPGGVLPLLEETGLLAEGEGPDIEGLYELDPEVDTDDDGGAEGPEGPAETLGELPPMDADDEVDVDPSSLFDRLPRDRDHAEWHWSDRAWDRRDVVSGEAHAGLMLRGQWVSPTSFGLAFPGPVRSMAALLLGEGASPPEAFFAVLADGTLWRSHGDRLRKLGDGFAEVCVLGDDVAAVGGGRLYRAKAQGDQPLEDVGAALALATSGEEWIVARDGGGEIHVGRGGDLESSLASTVATFPGEAVSHLAAHGEAVAALVDGALCWAEGGRPVALPKVTATALALLSDRRANRTRVSLLAAVAGAEGTLFVLFDGPAEPRIVAALEESPVSRIVVHGEQVVALGAFGTVELTVRV
jgi:hypothetical protein